jgi:hypothetical protein
MVELRSTKITNHGSLFQPTEPYNLTTNDPNQWMGEHGQVRYLDVLFGEKTNGFFVEAGALKITQTLSSKVTHLLSKVTQTLNNFFLMTQSVNKKFQKKLHKYVDLSYTNLLT